MMEILICHNSIYICSDDRDSNIIIETLSDVSIYAMMIEIVIYHKYRNII